MKTCIAYKNYGKENDVNRQKKRKIRNGTIIKRKERKYNKENKKRKKRTNEEGLVSETNKLNKKKRKKEKKERCGTLLELHAVSVPPKKTPHQTNKKPKKQQFQV